MIIGIGFSEAELLELLDIIIDEPDGECLDIVFVANEDEEEVSTLLLEIEDGGGE